MVTAEGPTQGASALVAVATGSEATTAEEAADSPAERTGRDSSSLRLLSGNEGARVTNPAASQSETLGAPAPRTPSVEVVSQAEVARVCAATGPPLAVAGGVPVPSIVAAPQTAGTAEKVGTQTAPTVTEGAVVEGGAAEKAREQTTSTMSKGDLASPEGSLTTKASTPSSTSSTPAPLEAAAEVACPIACTPCSSGGVDSREPLPSVAAAPTMRPGPPFAGPKGVEVAASPASSGLVTPLTSCVPGKAAPAAVCARENADSIATASEEEPALSATTSGGKATTIGRVAAPSMIPSKAPSSAPPVSVNNPAAEASPAPPVGASNAVTEGSAKPLGTARDGLPLAGDKQSEGGGALLPARGVSPLLGGATSSATETSAKPSQTAGDGLPLRGDTQTVGGGSSLPTPGVSAPPAATTAGGQLMDVLTPSGVVVEMEESLGLDHGPTITTATCVPAKNAVTTPISPLSTLAHMAMTGFGSSQSDPERGQSVSVDREVDGSADEEAAVVISANVGGVASSVTQACKVTVVEQGPSLEDLEIALNLLSHAVKTNVTSSIGLKELEPVFSDLEGAAETARRTGSVETRSLDNYLLSFRAVSREMQVAIATHRARSCSGDARIEGAVGDGGPDGVGTSPSGHEGTSPAEGGASGGRGGDDVGGSGGEGTPTAPRELALMAPVLCWLRWLP